MTIDTILHIKVLLEKDVDHKRFVKDERYREVVEWEHDHADELPGAANPYEQDYNIARHEYDRAWNALHDFDTIDWRM